MQSLYWISDAVVNSSCSLVLCACYKQKIAKIMLAETVQDKVRLGVILPLGRIPPRILGS